MKLSAQLYMSIISFPTHRTSTLEYHQGLQRVIRLSNYATCTTNWRLSGSGHLAQLMSHLEALRIRVCWNAQQCSIFSNLKALPASQAASVTAPGGNLELWETTYKVTATISGKVAGAAVPQLYIALPASAGKERQLSDFGNLSNLSLLSTVAQR